MTSIFAILTPICLLITLVNSRVFEASRRRELADLDLGAFDQQHENQITHDELSREEILEHLMNKLSEGGTYSNQEGAKEWMKQYNNNVTIMSNELSLASWDYQTNITEYTSQYKDNLTLQWLPWAQYTTSIAEHYYDYKEAFNNESLVRMLGLIARCGDHPSQNDAQKVQLSTKLETLYGSAVVQDDDGNEYQLEPELTEIMEQSEEHDDYERLLWAWKGWRDVSGKLMKDDYERLVQLQNEAVKDAGYFDDMGEMWRACNYEEPEVKTKENKNLYVKEMAEDLYDQIQPLYEELHAYVRYKLRGSQAYPEQKDVEGFEDEDSPIPAHLLGNMWAQQWSNIIDLVKPFPEAEDVDVTPQMIEQGWNASRMFRVAEEFFYSIGLMNMTATFWNKSMITHPTDSRKVVCHASADDFSIGDDYRIKMCTTIKQTDLQTVHHEMGHIEYFMSYRHQPQLYRAGANSAFHEAIGDTIALSVMTPTHLKRLNLLREEGRVAGGKWHGYDKRDINFLMKMALDKIAFLPFGYLIDKWRWDVYSGDVPKDQYNRKWWYYRLKYQGIAPPIKRSEADFDPGAKYHVAADVPYIRYFFSFIGQFQFHKALCTAAGHDFTKNPLHTCDIYESKAAGHKLRKMLELGSSKPWPDAMEQLTETRKFDASAIINYFRPVMSYLQNYRTIKGYKKGWKTDLQPFFE